MRSGDKCITPAIDFTATKYIIENFLNPVVGMRAVTTDTQESGFYDGSQWVWGSSGGTSKGTFQRNLSANLTLVDGECLTIVEYINVGSYELTINGDAEIRIL